VAACSVWRRLAELGQRYQSVISSCRARSPKLRLDCPKWTVKSGSRLRMDTLDRPGSSQCHIIPVDLEIVEIVKTVREGLAEGKCDGAALFELPRCR
jgi:hypothetical protein